MTDFPDRVEAVILAGGPLDSLQWEGPRPISKGFLKINGWPMAAIALEAAKSSPKVARTILVSPVPEVNDPAWPAADCFAPAAEKLVDSFCNGVEAALDKDSPVLICCGDMPLLTSAAVTDFVEQCSRRPQASIWYGYLRRDTSDKRFPGDRHTWAKLADGTFCGTGMMMMRPGVVPPVRARMEALTKARKNMPYLASQLGWGTIFSYLTGRLTVPKAESAGTRIFGVECVGVESPYAETGFNVDDSDSLRLAQKRVPAYAG